MKCWRCGRDRTNGLDTCLYCGAVQERGATTSEVGRSLRYAYDRCGAQELLKDGDMIAITLGAAGEGAKKARSLFRTALDAGVGRLYLEQLRAKGRPDPDFVKRVRDYLTDEAGLNDRAAGQLVGWFDEMIGWTQVADLRAQRSREYRSGKILGIDLGGSTARAAVIEGGQAVLIPNRSGGIGRPCAVGFRDGRVLLCEEALRQAISCPDMTAVSFKRTIAAGEKVTIGDKAYAPQLVTAFVLRKLRQDAVDYLGEDPADAVITVPNCYTSTQRQAVIDAGRLAGLNVRRLITSTSAALLDIGFRQEGDHWILVCDLGSSSFDISVTNAGDGVAEVLASGGDAKLGGDDFTECIVRWMESAFLGSRGIDLSRDPIAEARLREAAETAKKELSAAMTTQIFVPNIAVKNGQPLHFDQTLSRRTFDDLTAPLRERARDLIRGVLTDAGLSSADIEQIRFVGGGSRMPAMQDTVRQVLGKDVRQTRDPDECAARGAAVMAGILSAAVDGGLLLEVTAHALGVETAGGVCTKLLERNTTYPVKRTQTFSTAMDDQVTVDVHLLEGESDKAAENETFGRFRIKDLPPAAKGVPEIEISFDIDQNGIISVSAKDAASGEERRLTSLDRTSFGDEQIREGRALVDGIVAAWEE